jgi:NAD-dependent SIR2 family protein deacetylase
MGVDSGLPDFRGDDGFWTAYPPYRRLGLRFVELANPRWFRTDPTLAWGFYGHRLRLYRATAPHAGFQILRAWAEKMRHGAFVFTSNVDGHFQKAGFDPGRVAEVHGSLAWLQCLESCGHGLFPSDSHTVAIDAESMRAVPPLPSCPGCGGFARPNVLMFEDWSWDSSRTDSQMRRLNRWLEAASQERLVIVECGAGRAVSTVRQFSEEVAAAFAADLIRINPREPDGPPGTLSFAAGALDTLREIDRHIRGIADEGS